MYYLTRDGRCFVERIRRGAVLVDKDGYHRVPGGSIYYSEDGRDDSIVLMMEGKISAYGDRAQKQDIYNMHREIWSTKLLGGRLAVDNKFSHVMEWLAKNGLTIGITVILVAVGITIVMNGGK